MKESQVRQMQREDLQRISELSTLLGYPASAEALERRYGRLCEDAEHALFVATAEDRIVGWIHAHFQWVLESEPYAEISALVVDREARRKSAGRALVLSVVSWARERGFDRIRVRSNISRTEAHDFYPALGFKRIKTQHNYELRVTPK